MFKDSYHIIGIMSGTSLDGIDMAEVLLSVKNKKWSYSFMVVETAKYSLEWINKLKNAINFSAQELDLLNQDYTQLLANEINRFMEKNSITNIDAVCSHGHTILHQPENGFTLQIGNLPELTQLIKQNVVCDFRVQDVKLGGQGAPLVPIGDEILFSEYDFCLNLGGFSNISMIYQGTRIAFDISPVNTVLNFYANQLGLDFDDKGRIAKSGKINQTLKKQLDNLDFYHQKHPKSLGFEFVKETIIPLIEKSIETIENKIATFSEHAAFQIAKTINYYSEKSYKKQKILITGGGAYNLFLIDCLKQYAPNIEVTIPEANTLEFKEALLFGLLGVLKLRNEINVLKSVTGAKKDHSSGTVYMYQE
jgi:anhydro-N-acetylmuramic acid kinase